MSASADILFEDFTKIWGHPLGRIQKTYWCADNFYNMSLSVSGIFWGAQKDKQKHVIQIMSHITEQRESNSVLSWFQNFII